MGIYNLLGNSPFDSEVEKATNETNTTEDWAVIMEICDKVFNNSVHAKECLKSITKRLNNPDPHVVVQAVTLLDACVNNCGKTFLLEVASREFEGELKKVLKKHQPSTTVGIKLRTLIRDWSTADFKADPQLSLMTTMWSRLQQDGVDCSIPSDPTTSSKSQRPAHPDSVSSQQEVDDIAKAIELSLKESSSPKVTSSQQPSGASSLYPSVPGPNMSSVPTGGLASVEPRKVRALYDFEAAEDNELTFFAGEIIHVLDDSDANWWKGCNQRGEGLFPANFVCSDLQNENKTKGEKKGVNFNETVEVKTVAKVKVTEIDEGKIDRVLHMLHEADPNADTNDPPDMTALEEDVMEMGPLIDAELERVDRKHAQLSQLSDSLVDAMKLYHSLMRDPLPKPVPSGLYHSLPPSLPQMVPPSSEDHRRGLPVFPPPQPPPQSMEFYPPQPGMLPPHMPIYNGPPQPLPHPQPHFYPTPPHQQPPSQ